MMELKAEIKKAIELEEKGLELYKKAAARTKNPVVRETFKYLAGQEQIHKRVLEEFALKHDIDLDDNREEVISFFNKTVKEFQEDLELTKDDLDAHKKALELERSSHDFYRRQHEKAEGETRDFFRMLMKQEDMHYELIEKAYHYMKDPVSFHSREESWLLEG